MHSKENKTNTIKATIKSVIVAFIYVMVIFAIIYILFADTISRAISLVDLISVETSKEELKDVKIDLTTKNLKSYPKYGSKYGNIKIPSLDVDLPLYYGDTLSILRYGVGHTSGSYFPGEGGSILYMGHNTSGMLRSLPEIEKGAQIIVETTYGKYTYEVYDTKIVEQTELEAAPIQRDEEMLILFTCYPVNSIGHAKKRFFTYSRLVEEQLLEN